MGLSPSSDSTCCSPAFHPSLSLPFPWPGPSARARPQASSAHLLGTDLRVLGGMALNPACNGHPIHPQHVLSVQPSLPFTLSAESLLISPASHLALILLCHPFANEFPAPTYSAAGWVDVCALPWLNTWSSQKGEGYRTCTSIKVMRYLQTTFHCCSGGNKATSFALPHVACVHFFSPERCSLTDGHTKTSDD